jgi:hypothetical protein
MTRKFLSLAMVISTAYLCLQGRLHSDDALFSITSDKLAVNLVLLMFAGLAAYLSFRDKFKYWQTYLATVICAILFGVVGLAGLAYMSIDNYFGAIIMPLDYVILLEIGVVCGICALAYEHDPVPLSMPVYNRVTALRIKTSLGNLAPKPTAVAARSGRSRPRPA